MIEFVTFFLGLVVGAQSVEVSAAPEVATVELLLDGETVDSLTEAPWLFDVDLGPLLRTHVLRAVARDAAGQQIAVAQQLVNVPRPRAEATLSLAEKLDGRYRTARLAWEALDAPQPRQVEIFLDGRQLAAPRLDRIALPDYDPESLHFLRANLVFADSVEASAEVVFGGFYAEDVGAELTAYMIRAPDEGSIDAAHLHFAAGARQVPVVAVEEGPLDVVVVRERDEALFENLRFIGKSLQSRALSAVMSGGGPFPLGTEDRVRFVFPQRQARTSLDLSDVLPVSLDSRRYSRGSLLHLVTTEFFPGQDFGAASQPLADAVAIAGLEAARGGRRRIVLLIASGRSADDSTHSPQSVMALCDSLQVPLVVWSIGGRQASPWPNSVGVRGVQDILRAAADLHTMAASQRIAWLQGDHLPRLLEPRGIAEELAPP